MLIGISVFFVEYDFFSRNLRLMCLPTWNWSQISSQLLQFQWNKNATKFGKAQES